MRKSSGGFEFLADGLGRAIVCCFDSDFEDSIWAALAPLSLEGSRREIDSSGGFEVKGREGEPPGPSRFISHDTTFTDTTSSVIDFGPDSSEESAAFSALSSDKHESSN